MFGINKRSDAVLALSLSDGMQGERRFAARFRTKDFDDPSSRNTPSP